MATDEVDPQGMSEEQLRAAYEAEIKRIRVEHVVLETVVTLINLGMRRTGLMPGTEEEHDPSQVQAAVDSVRALMPTLERVAPEQAGPIRDALSQLQLAFVQSSGAGAPAGAPAQQDGGGAPAAQQAPVQEPVKPGEPGPAQRSGRLWVPGQ